MIKLTPTLETKTIRTPNARIIHYMKHGASKRTVNLI